MLTSSMSGQAGTYGYSAYSPTKFVLQGFAEYLSMELAACDSNVHVSLSYPPDTRTPGYENENRNKPEGCRLISESAGVWDPDVYVYLYLFPKFDTRRCSMRCLCPSVCFFLFYSFSHHLPPYTH